MGFLVPSTDELTDSAISKFRTGEATTIPIAVRKAVEGRGITAKADLGRRTREVLREMQRRSAAAKRAKKAAEETAKKIAEYLNK
ncbi:MAG: hypothetical protein WDZ56_01520 [Candidatus Paceibacterota bacterium]